YQKINGANRLGGPLLAVQAVQSISGIRPDYYAVMNLQGLVNVVDSLGGVTVRVPQSMRYADHTAGWAVNLQPGIRTLNGSQAMGFVRFRHDGKGDRCGRGARRRQDPGGSATAAADWSVPHLVSFSGLLPRSGIKLAAATSFRL